MLKFEPSLVEEDLGKVFLSQEKKERAKGLLLYAVKGGQTYLPPCCWSCSAAAC